MLIPNKYSGYRAGIRLYPGGGGGGGGGGDGGPADAADGTDAGAGGTGVSGGGGGPAADAGGADVSYGAGSTTPGRTATTTVGAVRPFGLNTQPGMSVGTHTTPPVYRPQYQNYSMTNPFSVSQYNRALSPTDNYYAQNPDVGRAFAQNSYGMGGEQFAQNHYQNYGQFEGRAAPAAAPMGFYNPYAQQSFNPYTNSFQTPFSYGGMGGYGGYGGMGLFGGMGQPQSFAMAAPRVSSGPSQAIVSRSAGVRGAPAVMGRFAEGGIAGLLK